MTFDYIINSDETLRKIGKICTIIFIARLYL